MRQRIDELDGANYETTIGLRGTLPAPRRRFSGTVEEVHEILRQLPLFSQGLSQGGPRNADELCLLMSTIGWVLRFPRNRLECFKEIWILVGDG